MPLKKPTYAERIEKQTNLALEKKLISIHNDLMKAYKAMKNGNEDTATWYWVAMESFKSLQSDNLPQKNKMVLYEKKIALQIAREAQAIINFKL
jgi:hypothetical protein